MSEAVMMRSLCTDQSPYIDDSQRLVNTPRAATVLMRGSASVTTVKVPLISSCHDDMNRQKTNDMNIMHSGDTYITKVVRCDIICHN